MALIFEHLNLVGGFVTWDFSKLVYIYFHNFSPRSFGEGLVTSTFCSMTHNDLYSQFQAIQCPFFWPLKAPTLQFLKEWERVK